MKIILKSMGGKGSKLHVDAEETVNSVKAKASKKLGKFPAAPYFGYFVTHQLTFVPFQAFVNSLMNDLCPQCLNIYFWE